MSQFLRALIISCFTGFLCVIPISFFTVFLSGDLFHFNIDMHIVIMLVLGCISCITLNTIINPLIYLFDNKTMMSQTSTALFYRYMPIYATPFALIFIIVFYEGGMDKEFLAHVFSIMAISYSNLFLFLNVITRKEKDEIV